MSLQVQCRSCLPLELMLHKRKLVTLHVRILVCMPSWLVGGDVAFAGKGVCAEREVSDRRSRGTLLLQVWRCRGVLFAGKLKGVREASSTLGVSLEGRGVWMLLRVRTSRLD